RVPREPDRPPADSPYPLHADPTLRAAASAVADWEEVYTTSASPADDPRLVARAWLCQAVERELVILCSLQFAPDPDTGRYMFRLAPGDLVKLLWLQFVRAISSGTRQQRCRECGKWFELLPKHRGRKEFCSTACKLREFRRRQSRAVELKAAGRTVKQIATELDTDIDTVKRWVGGKANRKEKGRWRSRTASRGSARAGEPGHRVDLLPRGSATLGRAEARRQDRGRADAVQGVLGENATGGHQETRRGQSAGSGHDGGGVGGPVGEDLGRPAEYSRRLHRGPRQPHPAHAGSSAGCGCQTLADRIPGRLAGEKTARGEHRPEGARPCED